MSQRLPRVLRLPILFNLTFAFSIVVPGTAFGASPSPSNELDGLYSTSEVRAPASQDWPEELAKDFVVLAPERSPASVKPVAAQKKPKVVAKAVNRRSRLPAAVSDGFELRVRYNKLTSMFWVAKRETKYDLMFANSSGSRASVSLSESSFQTLYTFATRLPASETSIAKCREASMQIHVVMSSKGERTTTMCVSDKSKTAEELRALSQQLAALVR